MKRSGIEGIVTGLINSRVKIVSGYPGAPSTNILEQLHFKCSNLSDIHIEWSVNEKQAIAMGFGAALAGCRAAVIMKHVGVNVASDAIIGSMLNDINNGFLIIVGDDPGGTASQNEQDSRLYSRLFKIPVLEPSDALEAEKMVEKAFIVSEKHKIPIMIRFTSDLLNKENYKQTKCFKSYQKRNTKLSFKPSYKFLPINIPKKHENLNNKFIKAKKNLYLYKFDTTIKNKYGSNKAIITSGTIKQRVNKITDILSVSTSIFNVGLVYPLYLNKIKLFSKKFEEIIVFEEGEPLIEKKLKANLNISIRGKTTGDISKNGKIDDEIILKSLINFFDLKDDKSKTIIKNNNNSNQNCPMTFCHLALKKVISIIEEKVIVVVDTGCSCLVGMENNIIDTFLCMGTSASVAAGISFSSYKRKVVAIMGDSSFLHSGIQSLLNAVYNGSNILFLIFDNGVTGETGKQYNPASGKTIDNMELPKIRLKQIIDSIKIESSSILKAKSVEANSKIIASYMMKEGVKSIIIKGICPNKCLISE